MNITFLEVDQKVYKPYYSKVDEALSSALKILESFIGRKLITIKEGNDWDFHKIPRKIEGVDLCLDSEGFCFAIFRCDDDCWYTEDGERYNRLFESGRSP